ncbi:hypothetical protein [Gracilimonas sp.]|uniref:hypothetical protein n=1 Tax=Gracilimonas sp. TaxID=1974203 RepID=UPI00287270E4|nr:hypothetical protein [Gracilimonas sp.]
MRILTLSLLMVAFCAIDVAAQSYKFTYHNPVDLYEGLDQNFYSESSFGVKNPIYSAFPVSENFRFNRVDGFFIGVQEEKMNWSRGDFLGIEDIDVHGMVGYSSAQNNFQYTIGAEKSIGDDRKWLLLGGELYNTTATEDYWRTGSYENSVSMLSAGFDFYDYHQSDGFGFYGILQPVKSIELGASYNLSQFSTLEARTDFSIFSRYSTFRPNPAIDFTTDMISQEYLTLGVTLNPNGISDRSTLSTTISAKAELSDLNGFSSNDFYYNLYQVEAKSYLRLDRSTLVKWRLMAGGITGNAPQFKNFALGGIGSMRALGYKAMQGNQMLLSNIELQFGQNSSKNGWPDLSSTTISFFLDSGTANFNNQLYSNSNPMNDFDITTHDLTHNVGVGLGLGMMRFEIAKPVAGAEGRSVFWIRLNPTF